MLKIALGQTGEEMDSASRILFDNMRLTRQLVGAINIIRQSLACKKFDPYDPLLILLFHLLNESRYEEKLWAIFLDKNHYFLEEAVLSIGLEDKVWLNEPEFKRMEKPSGARYVYFLHNHPTEIPYPSMADRVFIEEMGPLEAATGLKVLDNLILAGDVIVSSKNCLK